MIMFTKVLGEGEILAQVYDSNETVIILPNRETKVDFPGVLKHEACSQSFLKQVKPLGSSGVFFSGMMFFISSGLFAIFSC